MIHVLFGPAALLALALPAAPIDIDVLLREADAASPILASARSLRLAIETTASQAEALPDPKAGVEWTNVGFDSFTLGDDEDAGLSLTWEQEFFWPGRRRLAGDVMRRETGEAEERIRSARLELRERILRSWAELYHADGSTALLSESRKLLVSLAETAQARYESGHGMLQEILRARTEISRLDADEEMYRQERRTNQALLNALAGRRDDPELGSALTLPELPEVEPDAMVASALAGSGEIREAAAAVRRAEAALELSRAALRPELSWGAAYGYRSGIDPMVTGSFGMRLPIWRASKQAQGIVEASHRLDAARLAAEAVRLRITAETRDAAARVQRAAAMTRLYSEAVVPQARSAFETASSSFAVSRADFLSVLTQFTTWLAYEQELVTQRHDWLQGLAGLERLAAVRLVPVGPEFPEPPSTEMPHE